MIFGVGVDIVLLSRIQAAMDRHGESFAKKILTDSEFESYLVNNKQVNFLAKRFAAKEAFSKALGTGFSDGLSLKHIQLGHTERGRPKFTFTDVAKQKIEYFNILHSHLSLSDEREHVIAFVTLEGHVRHSDM